MQLLRWNNPGHDTTPASSMVRGAGGREPNPRLRRREKNVLDIPLYRTAITLKTLNERYGDFSTIIWFERISQLKIHHRLLSWACVLSPQPAGYLCRLARRV